jgi:hypothetical protein
MKNAAIAAAIPNEKRRDCGVFCVHSSELQSGHGLDSLRQAALVARGLVLVDDFLVGNAVNHAHGRLQNSRGGGLVACGDGSANFLDGGTQLGTLGHVVGALDNCLTGALAGLGGIRHEI